MEAYQRLRHIAAITLWSLCEQGKHEHKLMNEILLLWIQLPNFSTFLEWPHLI